MSGDAPFRDIYGTDPETYRRKTADPDGRLAARCVATSKRTGKRCGMSPIPGATVCKWHGGGSPRVKEKARIRLAQLVDPAIAVHAQAMVHAPKWGDRLRAAESVLDRAGYPRRTEVDIDMARAALKARLAADDPVIEMEAIGDGSND